MSGRYAHMVIDAVEVVDDLKKLNPGSLSVLPSSEKVARQLVSLSPVDRGIVWDEAVKDANGKGTDRPALCRVERVGQSRWHGRN
jgi:hypothetical protein